MVNKIKRPRRIPTRKNPPRLASSDKSRAFIRKGELLNYPGGNAPVSGEIPSPKILHSVEERMRSRALKKKFRR